MMDEIVDWYWQHGVQRGSTPSVADPDWKLRKVSVAHWLDPVARLLRRREAIARNLKGKACIALWGPSQTGKSTMLSRYVDGASLDGVDSALTWNSQKPVRFSPAKNWSSLELLYPNTLVFNPFNQFSDASGLASRYVLREDGDATVNTDFPVEVKLSTDMQLMHALSIGYQEECQSAKDGEISYYTAPMFFDMLEGGGVAQNPDRAAYQVLRDLVDSLEFMRGQARFSQLFVHGGREWKTLRQRIMDSRLINSVAEAQRFRSEILWDGSSRLTGFFDKVASLGADLRAKWSGYKIVASPEVAAILLDIDSFRVYCEPGAGVAKGKVKDHVARLSWALDSMTKEVRLSVGVVGSPEISGQNFGYFQALCAELIVPLRKSALTTPEKAAFLALLEKCDVLDLPGLSNVNKGGVADSENTTLVKLSEATDIDLFKKVFKEGKTQSFVYNYANEYAVDAFLVLARAKDSPSKSAKLSAGIRSWLRSYDPEWQEGHPASMPVFLDLTFFATCVNSVSMSGIGTGLAPYATRFLDVLPFADKATAKWFVTTYPQFGDGQINSDVHKDKLVDLIMHDETFAPRTGLEKDDLEAVFEADGGVNHMLLSIAGRVDANRKRICSERIVQDDWRELEKLIRLHLPQAATGNDQDHLLQEIGAKLEEELIRIEQQGPVTRYADLAKDVKDLFNVSPGGFDAIPEEAGKKDLTDYVQKQRLNWYDNKLNGLEDCDWLDVLHQQALVSRLRNVLEDKEVLVTKFIRTRLGQLTDRTVCVAGTYALAIAFENIFWNDAYDRESTVSYVGDGKPEVLNELIDGACQFSRNRRHSAHFRAIIKPFQDRLVALQDANRVVSRPPQPGDEELAALLNRLSTFNRD